MFSESIQSRCIEEKKVKRYEIPVCERTMLLLYHLSKMIIERRGYLEIKLLVNHFE